MSDNSKTSDKSKYITLNCIILSERVNDIFDVTISNANNNRVSSLTEAIKTHHPDQFQDINSTSLDLYKAEMLSGSVVIHKAQNSSSVKIKGGTKMELQ